MAKHNSIYEIMSAVRKHCISKDETRPGLQGVYFDESEVCISTDGHVLSHSQMLFQDALKGLVINDNFEVIKREYPKWSTVIPTKFKNSITTTLNKNMLKKGKKPSETSIYFDGENFKHEKPEKIEFAVNSQLLKPILNMELSVRIEWNEELGPIKITFNDDYPNEFMIIMPLKV